MRGVEDLANAGFEDAREDERTANSKPGQSETPETDAVMEATYYAEGDREGRLEWLCKSFERRLAQAQAKLAALNLCEPGFLDRVIRERDEAQAKLQQSELEARRYRHLRDTWITSTPSVSVWWTLPGSWSAWSSEDLDKAIDE